MSKKESSSDKELQAKYDKFKELVEMMGLEREEAMIQMADVTQAKLEEAGRNMTWLTENLPSADALPMNWHVLRANWDAGTVDYGRQNKKGNFDLAVIASCSLLGDGHGWLHVGVSHPLRYPSWDELLLVRQIFSEKSPMVYATVPSGSQVLAEQEMPIKLVNLYVDLGSVEQFSLEV